MNLNHARLPIPPFPHGTENIIQRNGRVVKGKKEVFSEKGYDARPQPGSLEFIFRNATKNESYTVPLPLTGRQKGGSCAADCSMISAS